MITAPSERVRHMHQRLQALVPGGAHTYAKGDDQFPQSAPPLIERGRGCRVWDPDGREYLEYGMGLRAVTLGHAFEPVVSAAAQALRHGVNFTRPRPLEWQAAEALAELVPCAEMVKFCKDGSHAVDGAVRLARAHTGRDRIAMCADHPFFSTGNWFIGQSEMNAGIPRAEQALVHRFRYNDLASLRSLFDEHPGEIACVILEAARTEEPAPGWLQAVQQLTRAQGAVLVFDEMITGFRWHLRGAQQVYGVTPDLATFGKALANGFGVSALAGRRELMSLGGDSGARDRVFLLSTTHGAQTHELAAALATMRTYREQPVVQTLYERGARLRAGVDSAVADHGLQDFVSLASRDCNLLFTIRDAQRQPSQAFRTLFMQELLRHGVIAPSFVVSFAHTEADVDQTVQAVHAALAVVRRALETDVTLYLEGRPVKPAVRRHV